MDVKSGALLCCLAAALYGCGDAGDHFGEFKRTGSRIVPVTKVTISMPAYSGPGTYPITVTGYEAHGNPVPAGQSYTNPIVLTTSGGCSGGFGSSENTTSLQSAFSIPNTTTQVFIDVTCVPVTITAADTDMATPVTFVFQSDV